MMFLTENKFNNGSKMSNDKKNQNKINKWKSQNLVGSDWQDC